VLTADELEALIESGEIDTIVMGFPDLQGRLVGKRITAAFFMEHARHEGTENCDYLIACDFDDNPVPGYRWASYDQGYGDMLGVADFPNAWVVPWVPRTAIVMLDLRVVDGGEPVEVAPRQVLRRQVEAANAAGFQAMIGSELEFYLFDDTYREAHRNGYRELTPHADYLEDYQIFQTGRDEYVIGAIRRGLLDAGIPVESSKGEAGRGQHELNIRYTTALQMADQNTIYKLAAKEIAAGLGRSVSFMAKWGMDQTGSSGHIHSSLWSPGLEMALFDGGHDAPHGMSDLFCQYLAGQIATAREFSLLWAPYVNSYKRFQPGSWAPTGIGWGVDNRTLGFRKVGHGAGTRVECRIPGSDINSYHAFAGAIAGGLYGIRHGLELPPAYEGNGYEATDIERIPWNIADAINLWERSEAAIECFGDDVHHHVLTAAKAEWQAFNQVVTDWELQRYWERA
jgi:glutamine synthetase